MYDSSAIGLTRMACLLVKSCSPSEPCRSSKPFTGMRVIPVAKNCSKRDLHSGGHEVIRELAPVAPFIRSQHTDHCRKGKGNIHVYLRLATNEQLELTL